MGRELRRKEERKNNNKNKSIKSNDKVDTNIKGSTIIKLVITTGLILVVLYYVIAIFITKEIEISWIKDNESTEVGEGVTNKILAKNVFNQREGTYYVYFYDFNDEDKNISDLVDMELLDVYRVDTGNALNKNYVTEENGNKNVTSIDNLKVKNPTLIEIKADKVTAYYEGSNEILDFLES